MARADALAAYERLPLPDTTEEHWRFTDLAGFDPATFDTAGVWPRYENVVNSSQASDCEFATPRVLWSISDEAVSGSGPGRGSSSHA